MKTINTEKIPIYLWLDDIDDNALVQAKNLANLPFAYHHIAIMPDAHEGYGMPIGGILAAIDYVVPNAVGVDIGCGMCAIKSDIKNTDKTILKKIMSAMREQIPLGFEHHKESQQEKWMPEMQEAINRDSYKIVKQEYKSALKQIGTLGGGNHFIEIQRGSDGYVWFMVHSGSRNIGKKVADHYNRLAVSLDERTGLKIPKEWELAALPVKSEEGKNYLQEMQYCVDFALANRELMIERIKKIIQGQFREKVNFEEPINIAHNYAAKELHFDKMVYVHRKGATLATKDTIGIVPGSQGSKSYIVRGRGNPDSYNSCSHGAGRVMSRGQARRELDLKKEIKKLDDLGIIHALRGISDLEEASSAYKSISKVMENQKDLVEILVELTPLAVVKGT